MERHLIHQDGRVVSEVVVTTDPWDHSVLLGDLAPLRVALFAQPATEELARRIAGLVGGAVRVLPDREGAKRIEVVADCYAWLNDLGLDRNDVVIGVGGGALTDLAGFVAATYLRGVTVVHVPTTLLGAVDAAIGGKTGINVHGKNLAGAFHHPHRVLIDTGVIAALPVELLREGSAEALKAGWVGDPALVDLYEAHGTKAPLAEIINGAVAVKVRIVSADFREQGVRAWLNYGHTVGHAVEVASGMSHGEAVAIGMVAAGAASRHVLGFSGEERQRTILDQLGLPTDAPALDPAEVRRLMALDKKRDGPDLRMTLLRDVADPVLTRVDSATVDVALAAVGLA